MIVTIDVDSMVWEGVGGDVQVVNGVVEQSNGRIGVIEERILARVRWQKVSNAENVDQGMGWGPRGRILG